ncbi:MAG: hypothetical protein EBY18_01165 [Alphaproteobacteria bacterium]|nr:hypothetical protein [Alphaproteobacteria bacterium]
MATAPADQTGQAGSALNVVRFLGISTGISAGSTVLALGMGRIEGSTLDVAPSLLVAASRDVILMLGILAALAGLISLIRPARQKTTEAHRDSHKAA